MSDRPRFVLDAQPIEVLRHPVAHIVVDGVFGDATCAQLLEHLVSVESKFAPAGIGASTEPADFRQHLVYGPDGHVHGEDAPEEFRALIAYRAARSPLLAAIDSLLLDPIFREVLGGAPFPLCKLREINRWETQVSRYGDGDHYGWHLDRIAEDDRVLSIAYYVSDDPPSFRGGELELSGGLARDGKLIAAGEVVRVEPKRDRMVLFSARAVHRVCATKAPADFASGRFSVNVFCGIASSPIDGRVY